MYYGHDCGAYKIKITDKFGTRSNGEVIGSSVDSVYTICFILQKKIDDFTIEALDLGTLTKLNSGHDIKEIGTGQMCDHVEVRNMADGTTITFPCDQWFDKKKRDKQIARDLFSAKP